MNSKPSDPKATALVVYRRPSVQVALPLFTTLARPSLDEATHAEAVAALARLLLDAAGVRDAEADDDA